MPGFGSRIPTALYLSRVEMLDLDKRDFPIPWKLPKPAQAEEAPEPPEDRGKEEEEPPEPAPSSRRSPSRTKSTEQLGPTEWNTEPLGSLQQSAGPDAASQREREEEPTESRGSLRRTSRSSRSSNPFTPAAKRQETPQRSDRNNSPSQGKGEDEHRTSPTLRRSSRTSVSDSQGKDEADHITPPSLQRSSRGSAPDFQEELRTPFDIVEPPQAREESSRSRRSSRSSRGSKRSSRSSGSGSRRKSKKGKAKYSCSCFTTTRDGRPYRGAICSRETCFFIGRASARKTMTSQN